MGEAVHDDLPHRNLSAIGLAARLEVNGRGHAPEFLLRDGLPHSCRRACRKQWQGWSRGRRRAVSEGSPASSPASERPGRWPSVRRWFPQSSRWSPDRCSQPAISPIARCWRCGLGLSCLRHLHADCVEAARDRAHRSGVRRARLTFWARLGPTKKPVLEQGVLHGADDRDTLAVALEVCSWRGGENGVTRSWPGVLAPVPSSG